MAINSNINFLSPNGFRLVFADSRFKQLEFYLQTVELPLVTLSETSYNIPYRQMMISGDSMSYEPFTANILCDENMDNFYAMHKWMKDILTSDTPSELLCDMNLVVLNSSNNHVRTVYFRNAFPTSMSGIAFDTGVTDVQYASFSVSFRYDYFDISERSGTVSEFPSSYPVA